MTEAVTNADFYAVLRTYAIKLQVTSFLFIENEVFQTLKKIVIMETNTYVSNMNKYLVF